MQVGLGLGLEKHYVTSQSSSCFVHSRSSSFPPHITTLIIHFFNLFLTHPLHVICMFLSLLIFVVSVISVLHCLFCCVVLCCVTVLERELAVALTLEPSLTATEESQVRCQEAIEQVHTQYTRSISYSKTSSSLYIYESHTTLSIYYRDHKRRCWWRLFYWTT